MTLSTVPADSSGDEGSNGCSPTTYSQTRDPTKNVPICTEVIAIFATFGE